jgi:hypothetical protein
LGFGHQGKCQSIVNPREAQPTLGERGDRYGYTRAGRPAEVAGTGKLRLARSHLNPERSCQVAVCPAQVATGWKDLRRHVIRGVSAPVSLLGLFCRGGSAGRFSRGACAAVFLQGGSAAAKLLWCSAELFLQGRFCRDDSAGVILQEYFCGVGSAVVSLQGWFGRGDYAGVSLQGRFCRGVFIEVFLQGGRHAGSLFPCRSATGPGRHAHCGQGQTQKQVGCA